MAIALIGKPLVEKYKLRPEKIIHREQGKRVERGSIKIWLSDQSKPVAVYFATEKGFRFTNRSAVNNLYVRGFGSTRLLPRDEDRPPLPQVPPTKDVENLFDPFDPLFDAEKWLPDLEQYQFDAIALAFKDILFEEATVKDVNEISARKSFARKDGQIFFTDPGGVEVSLDEMSDGYQSVLAMAVDIIAGIPGGYSDFRYAPGIILIDEIGANLHPRWRMTFVKSLRRAFPRMQFLATTHEPLCLRGLEDGEAAVMKRQNNVINTLDSLNNEDGLPSLKRMRASQLLTSPYFGLFSTVDPDIDREFQTYYDLLARGVKETDDSSEGRLLKDLKEKLNKPDYSLILGNTRRDQLVYELIDEYLSKASQGGSNSPKMQDLKKSTKERVFEIWQRSRFFINPGQIHEGSPET